MKPPLRTPVLKLLPYAHKCAAPYPAKPVTLRAWTGIYKIRVGDSFL